MTKWRRIDMMHMISTSNSLARTPVSPDSEFNTNQNVESRQRSGCSDVQPTETPGVWWSCSIRPAATAASHPHCWLSKRGRGGGPDVPHHNIKTVLMVRNLLVCGSVVRVTRCHVTGVTWRLSAACVTASRLRGVSAVTSSPHLQWPLSPLSAALRTLTNLLFLCWNFMQYRIHKLLLLHEIIQANKIHNLLFPYSQRCN